MTETIKFGTATGTSLANDVGAVSFPCPQCGHEIHRTRKEREIVIKYVCPNCGFEGPNQGLKWDPTQL